MLRPDAFRIRNGEGRCEPVGDIVRGYGSGLLPRRPLLCRHDSSPCFCSCGHVKIEGEFKDEQNACKQHASSTDHVIAPYRYRNRKYNTVVL